MQGINSVQELADKSEADMMKVRNLGRKSLEVKYKLEDLGLGLRKKINKLKEVNSWVRKLGSY